MLWMTCRGKEFFSCNEAKWLTPKLSHYMLISLIIILIIFTKERKRKKKGPLDKCST